MGCKNEDILWREIFMKGVFNKIQGTNCRDNQWQGDINNMRDIEVPSGILGPATRWCVCTAPSRHTDAFYLLRTSFFSPPSLLLLFPFLSLCLLFLLRFFSLAFLSQVEVLELPNTLLTVVMCPTS